MCGGESKCGESLSEPGFRMKIKALPAFSCLALGPGVISTKLDFAFILHLQAVVGERSFHFLENG